MIRYLNSPRRFLSYVADAAMITFGDTFSLYEIKVRESSQRYVKAEGVDIDIYYCL